ncbi:MatE efflux family protein, putative [Ichthyophthirius multifiliis]|uniref:MatE efflux family protein, putative n=1 Tax=Ichthyophthirius multifiliis TaxID=5932 RepID=G0QMG2_ICHMU|nr:MatE efflux family protein, putative [Ichthyophthirius multifiliis]EGR33597.1 MatE efflux family protein, putative [Ichthyophthirius multifiliis]|eukprot:XP_004037583.1 MatE efflux family protein, putative [Ichthyophthirius multifiliis]
MGKDDIIYDDQITSTSQIKAPQQLSQHLLSEMHMNISNKEESKQVGKPLDQVSQQFLSEINQPNANFKWLLMSCIETAVSVFFEIAPTSITIMFLSNKSNQDTVSGYGLAMVLSNCIGQSVYYGLSSGLETMAAHAYGAKNYPQVGLLLYKCQFVMLLLFIPITICMIFAKEILLLWNTNIHICEIAQVYCIWCIPGLFFTSIFYSMRGFLNAQNEYRIQMLALGIGFPFNALLCYIFITWLDWGVIGAAISYNILRLFIVILFFVFIEFKKQLKKCYIPLSRQIYKNLWPFLKVAVPIGSVVASDWIIYEAQSIIASNLEESQYAAHIVLANLNVMLFSFSIGYSVASCTFIGNEMGRRNAKKAKQYAYYSQLILLLHLIVFIVPLTIFKNYIADIFTVDEKVKSAFIKTFYFFIAQNVIIGFETVMSAYTRAIGKERFLCIIFFLCNGLLGLVLSVVFAYQLNWKLDGIWLGMIAGVAINSLLQLVKISFTDVNIMADKISKRINENDMQHSIVKSFKLASNG